jgi:hypothetical protein
VGLSRAAVGLDGVDDPGRRLLVDVGDDDRGAGTGQPGRDGRTDAVPPPVMTATCSDRSNS